MFSTPSPNEYLSFELIFTPISFLWTIHTFNPVTHGPLCPPLTHGPQADLPYKNRADLPKGCELRATVIAALSLRVS